MSFEFVAHLPKHLEEAYRSGKVVVDSGVVRDSVTGAIKGHLELGQGFSNFISEPATFIPRILISVLRTYKEYKNDEAIAENGKKLDQIIDLTKDNQEQLKQILQVTQQVKLFSMANLAISGITLGVVVAGFAVVIHQIKQINQKIDDK